MDRVHYRRVIQSDRVRSRGEYPVHQVDEVTPGDTVILQCIVSGILLVAVLLVSLADIAPANVLREGVRYALVGANTIEELTTDLRHFSEEWLGWDFSPNQVYLDLTPLPEAMLPTHTISPEITEYPPTYQNPLTANDETVSNPQIPAPSVVPGLWD